MSVRLPAKATKAEPAASAGRAKRALWAGQKTSSRKRLASCLVVIPARRSSWGKRFCKVPNMRSERPRASGE